MSQQARVSKTPSAEIGHGRSRSRSMSNTPPVLATPIDTKLHGVPEPPDTPPPLEHAYSSHHVPGSVSDHSSPRSTPELAIATPYAHHHPALHPSSRVSQSPEIYTASSLHSASHWAQHDSHPRYVKVDSAYGYSEREQPPSPASSVGSQYAQQPVSPNAPYSYAHYGAQQQSSSSQGKYESSPRKSPLSRIFSNKNFVLTSL